MVIGKPMRWAFPPEENIARSTSAISFLLRGTVAPTKDRIGAVVLNR
jgi:hypothetical protein